MTDDSLDTLFDRLKSGSTDARNQLFPLIYHELHGVARRHMAGQPPAHTLRTTDLVNQAYVRLFHNHDPQCASKDEFLRLASTAMRHILVDHARRRTSDKRSPVGERVALDTLVSEFQERAFDLLALNAALECLAERDAPMAQLVDLKFFGGRTMEESARILGISERTAHRWWETARNWLRREVDGGTG